MKGLYGQTKKIRSLSSDRRSQEDTDMNTVGKMIEEISEKDAQNHYDNEKKYILKAAFIIFVSAVLANVVILLIRAYLK